MGAPSPARQSGVATVPAAASSNERVETILEDHRLHGYTSPVLAADRLRAASDRPGADAPLELRLRYHVALAELSLTGWDDEAMEAAVTELEAMALHDDCVDCRAQALIIRARAAMDRGEPAVVADLLGKAEALIDKDQDPRLHLALLRAQVRGLETTNMLTGAIATAIEAITLADTLGNVADRVKLLNQLGRLNALLGNNDRALAVTEEALVIARSIGFIQATAALHLDQSHIHAQTGRRAEQFKSLENALKIAEANSGMDDIEVISLSNMADYHLSAGNYEQALKYAERGGALARRIGSNQGLILANANAGIAMSQLGDESGGIARLEQAVQMARSDNYEVYEVGITSELVQVLERAGRYQDALRAMHEVAALNAKITAQEREKAVLELQAKYDDERKNREIERLSAQAELKKAEIDVRSSRQRLWAALAVAAGLAAVLLAQWLQRARKANRRLAVDNASLAEQSVVDTLTGAFNRRHFHALMDQLASTMGVGTGPRKPQLAIGLMLLDIDHFKAINDTQGHAVGDVVLVELTRRLQGLLREQDAVVRWGGEEFVLVLPGTPAERLGILAERIMLAIGGKPFENAPGVIDVTVSIGCVAFTADDERQWHDALQLADAAMYLAKQRGRNCAVCVELSDPGVAVDAIGDDLVAAEHAGHITLVTVKGAPKSTLPAQAPPLLVESD